MIQGVQVGESSEKSVDRTVPTSGEVISKDKYLEAIVHTAPKGEAIVIEPPFYKLTPLTQQASSGREFFIRIFDILGCAIIFIFAIPIMLVVALLIKIFSTGPILYKQERVGRYGKIFMLYKFRTMINNSEEYTGPVWAVENDLRVTPLGKILRKSRLDELPQLLNVLKGDMSLVGPRPERPYFVKRHDVLRGIRLAVKPGLTGLAQIRSFYDLKPEHKIKYDSLYIRKRSLLLNIYILLQTVPVVFCKKGW